jgi:hypothetical protein
MFYGMFVPLGTGMFHGTKLRTRAPKMKLFVSHRDSHGMFHGMFHVGNSWLVTVTDSHE